MTYGIAAAGTGGHVLPALAVAEALVAEGVPQPDITFFGGERFEATAVPAAGYELVQLRLQGLKRSLTLTNFRLPGVIWAAVRETRQVIVERGIGVMLCTGGYVTVPCGIAARLEDVPTFVTEQNAHAGVANRLVAHWSETAFTAFESTEGLPKGVWVGNPVRASLSHMKRPAEAAAARMSYGLDPNLPTVGIVGGSLGARALNEAIASGVERRILEDVQIVHLAGTRFVSEYAGTDRWKIVGFEDRMERFFAATDLVVSRAGGMVAEITATGTPSILVPGAFGSKGHQEASARALEQAGAAVLLPEKQLSELGEQIVGIIKDDMKLRDMAAASVCIGKPDAAQMVAEEMMRAHG